MARQTSILTFTGRLGKQSGFKRNGEHYTRYRSGNITQTPNMKQSATQFGMASSTGAFIRKSLNITGDGGHVNRITKALIPSAGKDLQQLVGVCFNNTKSTSAYFTKPPVLSKNGVIHIPAQSFPKNARFLEIQLHTIRIDLQSRELLSKNTSPLLIDTSLKFKGTDLPIHIPGPGTLILALSVNNSAEIIAVIAP